MPADDEMLVLLRTIGDNAATLRSLVAQVRSVVGVMPFVGAGMSVPFKFRTWKDFLLDQAPLCQTEDAFDDMAFELHLDHQRPLRLSSITIGRGVEL